MSNPPAWLAWVIGLVITVATVPSWAGPTEDKALRDAAGCSGGHLDAEAVKAELKLGANPNAPSKTARPLTPLGCVAMTTIDDDEAVNRKAVEVAKILLNVGANLGPAGGWVLFFPIASGNLEMVRLFIDKGASPTAKLDGFTPTELARNYDQSAVYDYLISRGGVPVDSTETAQLALIEAAGGRFIRDTNPAGRDEVIAKMERAVGKGASINGTGPTNESALIAAVRRRPILGRTQVDIVRWLLNHGADPNQKGNSGFQGIEGLPLHIFVAMNVRTLAGEPRWPEAKPMAEETLQLLLKSGAKVSGMDSQGRTPLHIAAIFDNVRAAEVLIKEGAKIMARDAVGKTPLDDAESAPMIKRNCSPGVNMPFRV